PAFVRFVGLLTVLFSLAAAVTITVLLTFPIHLLALGWNRLVSWKKLDAWFAKAPRAREAIAYAAPVAGYSLLQIFLYFDRTIYRLYDYHLNGFVWNLLTTRGGVEALGSGSATKLTFALIVVGFAALQAGLLLAVLTVRALR